MKEPFWSFRRINTVTYFSQRIAVGLGGRVIKLSSVKTWPFSSQCCHQANHRNALKHPNTAPEWIIHQSFTRLEGRPSHPCHIFRIEKELNRFLVLLSWGFSLTCTMTGPTYRSKLLDHQNGWGERWKKKTLHGLTQLNFIAHLSTKGAAACLIKPIDLCLTPLLWLQCRIAWGSVQSTLNPEKSSTLCSSLPNYRCNCVIVQRHQSEINFSMVRWCFEKGPKKKKSKRWKRCMYVFLCYNEHYCCVQGHCCAYYSN